MKKIYQTTFGGVNAPDEEKGNCWQACVASLLEIPLEEAFDCRPYWDQGDGKWFDDFNAWLKDYGLACIAFDHTEEKPLPASPFLGYHLGEFKSATLKNGETHICVIHNGDVVHDPNPRAERVGDALGLYLFVPLDPVEWSK